MISPEGVIESEWSVFGIAVILFGMRVALHFKMQMRGLFISDFFLLLAVFCCLGLVICDTMTFRAGVMANFSTPLVSILKARFATNYFFDVGLYFPKFSMLAFYFRLIPATVPQTRKALVVMTCFVVLSSVVTFFADTFWCGSDPTVNWSQEIDHCNAFTSMTLAKINWSLNFTAEVLIFFAPLPLISGLNLRHKRERAGLLVVFLLGAITIIVSTARFIAMLWVSNNIAIYVLATTEFAVSIMVSSAIRLRPLLRKIHSWTVSDYLSKKNSATSNITSSDLKDVQNYIDEEAFNAHRNRSLLPSHRGSRIIYPKMAHARCKYGSEIELTEQEPTVFRVEGDCIERAVIPRYEDDQIKSCSKRHCEDNIV